MTLSRDFGGKESRSRANATWHVALPRCRDACGKCPRRTFGITKLDRVGWQGGFLLHMRPLRCRSLQHGQLDRFAKVISHRALRQEQETKLGSLVSPSASPESNTLVAWKAGYSKRARVTSSQKAGALANSPDTLRWQRAYFSSVVAFSAFIFTPSQP